MAAPRVDLAAIVDAAVREADAHGLAAVDLGRVADVLDVPLTVLRVHVQDLDQLRAHMVEAALSSCPSLPAGWRHAMEAWVAAAWERTSRHPWLMEAAVGRRSFGPNEILWVEAALSRLEGLPLTGAEKMDLVSALRIQVRGAAQQSLVRPGYAQPTNEVSTSVALSEVIGRHPDRFPALLGAIGGGDGRVTGGVMPFGVGRMLDGVAAFMSRRAGRPIRDSE